MLDTAAFDTVAGDDEGPDDKVRIFDAIRRSIAMWAPAP